MSYNLEYYFDKINEDDIWWYKPEVEIQEEWDLDEFESAIDDFESEHQAVIDDLSSEVDSLQMELDDSVDELRRKLEEARERLTDE